MELKDERPIVVGIGEVVMDCYQDSPPKLGGAPLIFAYHAAKTHCQGVIISAVGNKDGNSIKDQVIDKGVIPVFNTVSNKPSGAVKVTLKDGDPNKPEYDIDSETAWTEIKYTKDLDDLSEKAQAVYFGTLASSCGGSSKDTIDKFLAAASEGRTIKNVIKNGFLNKNNNVLLKIFDVNLRKGPDGKQLYDNSLIEKYVKECNILKVNKEELEYLAKLDGIEEEDYNIIGERLIKHHSNVIILILTKREKGSTIFWKDVKVENKVLSQSIHITVDPKNTVGAGDAMAGAFIGELLNGKKISDAHYYAALRSDLVCREKGSMPTIPGPDIFISYAWDNEEDVTFFCKKFEDKHFEVWRDQTNVMNGEKLNESIIEAINNCRVFVYFSSEVANQSKSVKSEIKYAIEKEKNIVTVKLDNAPFPEELKSYIKARQYFDFNRFFKGLEKMI